MPGSPRQCPKCSRPIQVFGTDTVRHVACPHCKALLQLGPGGIEVTKPTKPRRKPRTAPPQPPMPPPVVGPSQATSLIVAAFVALGVVALGGVAGTLLVMLRTTDEPTGTPSMANTPLSRPSALDLRTSEQQRDRDDANQLVARERAVAEQLAREKAAAETSVKQKTSGPGASIDQTSLPPSLIETIERVRNAVVTIDADGVGSGFVVDRRRWLATNFHVVAGVNRAKAVRKRDNGEDWIEIAVEGFVACDPRKDLVILVLEKDWPAEPLSLSGDKPRLGEDVFAVGAPSGLMETVSRGIVSQIRTAADVGHESLAPSTTIIQTDAFIANGSSGGPLCSAAGKVVGINSFGLKSGADSAKIHFAIAAEELANLIQKAVGPTRPLNELPVRRE